MVVLDDLHNADAGALLLTRFLIGALDRLPLVLLLACRDGGAGTLLDELVRDATAVPLRRFTMQETAALLAAHGQRGDEHRATAVLLQVTGGIPLFLAHAIGRGRDTGPTTVQQAIADALGRLPARTHRLLALAAVLGAESTVGDIAALAEEPPTEVAAALAEAAVSGLVDLTPSHCAFHDLVQQVALAQLDTSALLDAHARAAALLAGTGHAERVAHHALTAATRSDADTARAIAACREAAASLRRGFAYEQAAILLQRAVQLAEHRPVGPERTELLLERAEAVLACGRLTEARAAFEAATNAAEHSGDPTQLARAVLGLGGVWVHEHRNAAVRQRVLAMQRTALAALPACERSLRCRLAVRLVAEAVYEGRPVEAVLDALAQARTVGDARTLAEALSLTHHALLGPEHAEIRRSLADELITARSEAGDGVLTLFGLLWRTVDLYLAGDPDAERSLTELRQRTDALDVGAVRFTVACIDVMRLIRSGRLEEAEAAAEECRQLGLHVGDADATGCYTAQLLGIRWLQGRDAELAELVSATAASGTLATSEYGIRASIASVLARAGRLDEARGALDSLLATGLDKLPHSSTWLATMLAVVDAARMLGDHVVVATAAELLRPYAALPMMPSLAVSCLGAVSLALGIAAMTTGDRDAAVSYLENAVEANQRWGHRPATALCRAELADALMLRGRPTDLNRARTLLDAAVTDAREMHLALREQQWSARAAALRRPIVPAVLREEGKDG
jgi:tetratricopeptide (TPR) repeat protein